MVTGYYSNFSYVDPISSTSVTWPISPANMSLFDTDTSARDWRNMKFFYSYGVSGSESSYYAALAFTTANIYPYCNVTVYTLSSVNP
jgi:hypothetical protein